MILPISGPRSNDRQEWSRARRSDRPPNRVVTCASENEVAASQTQLRGQSQQRGESGSVQEAHAAQVDDDHGRAVEGTGEARRLSDTGAIDLAAELHRGGIGSPTRPGLHDRQSIPGDGMTIFHWTLLVLGSLAGAVDRKWITTSN